MKTENVHEWTLKGLGEAPFKFKGVYSIPSTSLAEANPTAYNNQLAAMPRGYGIGQCGVCGMCLTHNFLIHSADGKKFAVGCDCVSKRDTAIISAIKAEKRKMEKAKRDEKRRLAAIERERKLNEKLEAERERNGGYTDFEMRKLELENANKEYQNGYFEAARDILDTLALKNSGNFVQDMVLSLSKGRTPSGRARTITIDIVTKVLAQRESGKTRGKAFTAALDKIKPEVTATFEKLAQMETTHEEKIYEIRFGS